MNAEEASMHARTYLLSKAVGWKDEQLLENLDVYAAVAGYVYSRKGRAEQLYKFSKQFILRLLRPIKDILKNYVA